MADGSRAAGGEIRRLDAVPGAAGAVPRRAAGQAPGAAAPDPRSAGAQAGRAGHPRRADRRGSGRTPSSTSTPASTPRCGSCAPPSARMPRRRIPRDGAAAGLSLHRLRSNGPAAAPSIEAPPLPPPAHRPTLAAHRCLAPDLPSPLVGLAGGGRTCLRPHSPHRRGGWRQRRCAAVDRSAGGAAVREPRVPTRPTPSSRTACTRSC